jgi:phage gp46-like protein
MTDIRLVAINQLVPVIATFDWLMTPIGTLDETQELATAITVALGTDRVANVDDDLPGLAPDDDRRGWWGDLDAAELWNGWPIGSRLWLLERGKITDPAARVGATVARAQTYIREALQPFIDQRIATAIDVTVERNVDNYSRIDALVTVYRGPKPTIALRFQSLWDEIG